MDVDKSLFLGTVVVKNNRGQGASEQCFNQIFNKAKAHGIKCIAVHSDHHELVRWTCRYHPDSCRQCQEYGVCMREVHFRVIQCSSNINKRVGRETTVNRRIVGWILSGGGVNHYPTWVCHMASHGQAYWRGKDRIKPLQRHSQFHGQGKTKSSKTES